MLGAVGQSYQPQLHKDLFHGAVETYKTSFETWLKQPAARPYVVAADSEEEALALLVHI